ncbi:coiled-coil domain-containing protein 162 [Leuresthes tenuis]|uniref:coiled-coil domain-containing protein 162 n=1 Tax=Leuresthes tenuis TaxID=355514 RepID=UPI003B508AE5
MNKQSIENLQVTLACQVTQKNALMSAVKLACVCHWAESVSSSADIEDKDVTVGGDAGSLQQTSNSLPSKASGRTPPSASTKKRVMGAFVSIQMEKVALRGEMLSSFVKRKQAAGGFIKTLEEAAQIKRTLITDFLRKFTTQISQHCVRAQIVAYYYSLSFLLEDIPSISQSLFMIGRAEEPKVNLDLRADPCPDSWTLQDRPQQLLSDDGKTLLNLWYLPHYTEVLHVFATLDVPAHVEALHHTLQIVSGLHDIIYYLVSFSRLGNRGDSCSWRRGQAVAGSNLVADWGGTEGIRTELQEIQQQVDSLSDPSSPQSVGRLLQLRRQVVLLQFDTAVRTLIREAFLSSGDVASYQSVSDNMVTALPLLSGSQQSDTLGLTLPVPQPLQTHDSQVQKLYPWRSFTACHGLLPLHVWDLPPIEYCMQLCLCGLSERSRLRANAAVLGVSLLLEDVLNSGREAEPLHLHGNKEDFWGDGMPNEEDQSCTDAEAEGRRTDSSAPLHDPIRVQSVLKGFLLLMKQLEFLKESWAQRRLGVETFRTPALYQQFVKLYSAEIFHPSMRALAQRMGNERDYEALISGRRSLLPPPGAAEVDVITWQLHLLMESTECDMIRAVQRRISREMTLAVSERTRKDAQLPTELWKKTSLKYSLSPERPQMVETFIQQLMKGADQLEGQLTLPQDHLQLCLTHLASSVMERERRTFQLYSQFYEQILQQETQLLYQRDQDFKSLHNTQKSNPHKEVADICGGMMLEISGLQARVAQLGEEKRTLEEQLSLKFRERYDPLVRRLFSACIQLKARLDENQQQMEQDVSEMVNRIRGEGVERIVKLKKKRGCTTENDGLVLTRLKMGDIHELNLENSRLTSLLCKVRALSRWRRVVQQEKLQKQLIQAQQREIMCRTDALRVKMICEEKVVFLQEELDVARQMLARCQAECSSTKELLSRKASQLHEARQQSAHEARSRRELDTCRVQSFEQMRADVEDRDKQLRELSEQLDRGSRMSRLQRQGSAREIRQVKRQLQQQRSLKQEAFQQVDQLQNRVNDIEAAFSRGPSTTDQSRTYCMLSASRLSTTSLSAGLYRTPRQHQQSALQLGSLTNYTTRRDFAAEPRHRRAETAGRPSNTRTKRPKAAPSCLRVVTAETSFPDL